MDAMDFLLAIQSDGLLQQPIDFEAVKANDSTPSETLDAWFGSASWRDDGHSFSQFGQDGTGGIYATWSYPDLKGAPPVVFLGSEGQAALVAESAQAFAQQLCNGSQWLSFEKRWQIINPNDFADEGEEDGADIVAIRARLVEALGPVDETAADMHARTTATHPDFGAWVTEMIDDLKATVEIIGRR